MNVLISLLLTQLILTLRMLKILYFLSWGTSSNPVRHLFPPSPPHLLYPLLFHSTFFSCPALFLETTLSSSTTTPFFHSSSVDALRQDDRGWRRFFQHFLRRDGCRQARSSRHLRRFGAQRGRRSQDRNLPSALPPGTAHHRQRRRCQQLRKVDKASWFLMARDFWTRRH